MSILFGVVAVNHVDWMNGVRCDLKVKLMDAGLALTKMVLLNCSSSDDPHFNLLTASGFRQRLDTLEDDDQGRIEFYFLTTGLRVSKLKHPNLCVHLVGCVDRDRVWILVEQGSKHPHD